MNTPTPRTDAEQKWLFSMNGQMQTVCVHSEFARQLERELVEATQQVNKLHEELNIADSNDEMARRHNLKLIQDRDEWKEIAEKLSEILASTLARFNAKKGQHESH